MNDQDQPTGGTLPYMSPDVLRGRPAREADDVWSLCVVLYEMVTGRRPFIGDGAVEIAASIRRQRIDPAGAGVEERVEGTGRRTERTGSPSSAKLIAFAVSILTAGRPARPATARAFIDALHGL